MTVLDVGGRVIQGGARGTFEKLGCKFTSLDMQADKSVDVVSPPGEPFPFNDAAFDIVITTSTFEHDPMFWMTIREMARVTCLDGWVYATSPHAGHYHPYPGDNYRFMHDAGAALAFWTGKSIEGKAYPLSLNATWLGQGGSFLENVMVWKRSNSLVCSSLQEKDGECCPTTSMEIAITHSIDIYPHSICEQRR